MPGGRLTHDERRAIEAGLGEGLSHAEIARRLSRPTSTVSREIMRNGGEAGYRADHAHLATRRRARRRKADSAEEAGGAASDGRRTAVQEFEERFTHVLTQTGLPRMMARVLACMYTAESDSMTAADLVRRLEVSPASVSNAVAFLEGQNLIRREREPGRRRERYTLDDDVLFHACLASARANLVVADVALQGAEILSPATPAGARLEEMSRFMRLFGEDLLERAESWREHVAGRRRG